MYFSYINQITTPIFNNKIDLLAVYSLVYQLRAIAAAQLETSVIEERFKKLMRRWTVLGIHAFIGIVLIFWLMVFKPLPVT